MPLSVAYATRLSTASPAIDAHIGPPHSPPHGRYREGTRRLTLGSRPCSCSGPASPSPWPVTTHHRSPPMTVPENVSKSSPNQPRARTSDRHRPQVRPHRPGRYPRPTTRCRSKDLPRMSSCSGPGSITATEPASRPAPPPTDTPTERPAPPRPGHDANTAAQTSVKPPTTPRGIGVGVDQRRTPTVRFGT